MSIMLKEIFLKKKIITIVFQSFFQVKWHFIFSKWLVKFTTSRHVQPTAQESFECHPTQILVTLWVFFVSSFSAHYLSLVLVCFMFSPKQFFFQCHPGKSKGWTLMIDSHTVLFLEKTISLLCAMHGLYEDFPFGHMKY